MCACVIRQIPVGQMGNFSYIVGDDGTGVCAIVDPGWDAAKIEAQAAEMNMRIEKILLTHAHYDHAGAVEEIAKSTGAPVFVHESEIGKRPAGIEIHLTHDGSTIDVGELEVRCMHTPGHSPGSQCFLVDDAVITGDTLFIDGCGRVDLPGGDPAQMLGSLAKLARLPKETMIYPGHDYGNSKTATIGQQLERNPYLTEAVKRRL